ncbi:ribonuclease [Diaphorobacter sp.]|uniref:ribonuclease n=1 Tax=Diaphorobacter sp. TaxID=1934310 RepID=UPI0028ACC2CB|nr:ribonuclease [Diaphorobacter sp.]
MLKAVAISAFKTGLAYALMAGCLMTPVSSFARETTADVISSPSIALVDMPREARTTFALIREGGPFPHDKDGTVFGNRERLLPKARRGYYREYTVRTPGARDRGARRIVCGGRVRTPDTCYYTNDHYASFREIKE